MVERIRTLLESRQLTPTQFADLIGVARPIISHVLSGRNKPSLEVVQRILGAMPDLSMAWLLNGTEPMLTAAGGAVPMIPAPRPAEAVDAPGPAVPPLPLKPAQPSRPTIPAHPSVAGQTIAAQINSNEQRLAEARAFPVVVPGESDGQAANAPAVATADAPVARPKSAAAGRAAMPRRFTAERPVTGPPEPVTVPGPLAPATPLLPASEIGLAPGTGPALPAAAETAISPNEKPVENQLSAANHVLFAEPAAQSGPPAVPDAVAPGPAGPEAGGVAGEVPGSATVSGTSFAPGGAMPATSTAAALFAGAEKPIRRIVIFYRDGSFADYQPE